MPTPGIRFPIILCPPKVIFLSFVLLKGHMAIPTKKEIIDFSPLNKDEPEQLPSFRRNSYQELKPRLKNRQILAITGLRRIGKTVLLKQLLSDEGAFYFSFDEKKYANSEALKAVIDAFLSEREKPTIALDEIFRVGDWAGVLKRYYDLGLAKFVLSGSSSIMMRGGIESLAGRMSVYELPPLQFDEYLSLSGKTPAPLELGSIFKAKERHETELSSFLKSGSFPEIVKAEEKTASEYIRTSTIERIVFDDIPSIFRIENPSKLYDLVRLCATNSSHLFTEIGFSEALQMSRHAVSDYLLYLSKAYLASAIYPEGSFQKALKKQKKIFVRTASIYNSLSESPNIGQAAETAAYDKLCNSPLSFYRDAQKREVDFISNLPIEVKYQSSITSADAQNLLYYMRAAKKGTGIIVTKNLFDEKEIDGKKIVFIPLDMFLLIQP